MTGENDKLIATEPTRKFTFRMWWGYNWRYFLCIAPFAIIDTLLTRDKGNSYEGDMSGLEIASHLLYLVASVVIMLMVFKRLFGKTFDGYRLVFLTPAASSQAAAAGLITVDPPYRPVVSLCWSYVWRAFLWSIVFGIALIILYFPLTFGAAALGGGLLGGMIIGALLVFLLLIPIQIWIWNKVFRKLMGKTFSGYRLVMLSPAALAQETVAPPPSAPVPESAETMHKDSV